MSEDLELDGPWAPGTGGTKNMIYKHERRND